MNTTKNNQKTPEERAVERFGSVEELRKKVVEEVADLNADVLLILHEIIIRIG